MSSTQTCKKACERIKRSPRQRGVNKRRVKQLCGAVQKIRDGRRVLWQIRYF